MGKKNKPTGQHKHKANEPVQQPKSTSSSAKATVISEPEVDNQLWSKIFIASLISVFLLMGIMSFWFGLSGDEVDMNKYGQAILKYFASFGSDDTVFHMNKEYDRDGVLMYYGGFFDFVCAIANKISPFGEYETRHLLNAWTGFLAIYFSAKIVAFIADKRLATLCVWLMFLSPFFLGHAMNNPKDIPLAAGYIASIYFIIRFFDKFPEVKWQDYLWVILSIGITINIRVAGILLIPYLFVYVGIIYIIKTFSSKENFELKTYTKPILILAVLGYLAGSLFWPYGLKNPISNPLNALAAMSDFKINLAQIWEGEKMMSGQLPGSYLIKSFFITNTYALIIGLLSFFVFIGAVAKSKHKHVIYFVAFTGLFPLFYIIYKKSNVYHAWRHVLFIFPSLVVIASLGWSYLNNYIAKRAKKAWVGLAIASVLLIEPIVFIVPTFPNTVTYYNQFAGGVKGAYGNYEMDYYYNSVKQCVDYFIDHELPKYKKDDTVTIGTNAAHLLYEYLGDYHNVKVAYVRFHERDMQEWDYALFHIALIPLEEIKAEKWLPPTTIFTAAVEGKPLSALIKRPSSNDLKGYKALEAGKREAAIGYFLKYIEEDSTNINVLNSTARVYMELNKMDSAYIYAAKAYNLDKAGAETKRVYAMALTYKGENEKALQLFTEIVTERPDFVMGYYYIAMVQRKLGKYQEAINNFNRIAEISKAQDPSLAAECYTYMGDMFKEAGDMAQANTMYAKANALR